MQSRPQLFARARGKRHGARSAPSSRTDRRCKRKRHKAQSPFQLPHLPIAIVGTEDDVRRRILALAEIGVTDLVVGEVLAPGETDTLRTRSLLAELARGRVSAT